jgi:hypothetical protein
MTTLATVYAKDEDVALRAAGDFALLCPRDQKLAAGTDGAFAGSDRWTLTSATVDFGACGLVAGQIVQLLGPTSAFKPPGESLAVVGSAPGMVTLRRKGEAAGVGQPPCPGGGLLGVEFLVATLGPQLEAASYDLNRRYGIDDLVSGRRSSDLYDPREVRDATVLTVLYRQYWAMSREAGNPQDTLAAKAQQFKAELEELLGRVIVHWLPAIGPGGGAASSRFGTRLAR